MEFSKQEHWSGLPFPSPGDLPNRGIRPKSPALQADSLPLSHQGSPILSLGNHISVNSLQTTCVNFQLKYLSKVCVALTVPSGLLAQEAPLPLRFSVYLPAPSLGTCQQLGLF